MLMTFVMMDDDDGWMDGSVWVGLMKRIGQDMDEPPAPTPHLPSSPLLYEAFFGLLGPGFFSNFILFHSKGGKPLGQGGGRRGPWGSGGIVLPIMGFVFWFWFS